MQMHTSGNNPDGAHDGNATFSAIMLQFYELLWKLLWKQNTFRHKVTFLYEFHVLYSTLRLNVILKGVWSVGKLMNL